MRVRFSLTALLIVTVLFAFVYALCLRFTHRNPGPTRFVCVAYDHSVGLARDFGVQNWGHHDMVPGDGTYLFFRVNGLANAPTDGSSYMIIGLQLPSNLASGQVFDCQPAVTTRDASEVDVNGDYLSRLTEGEFVAYGFAYPQTGWIPSNSQPNAKVTIQRTPDTRIKVHIRFATQFDPDVGVVDIDETFTFVRDKQNAK